MTETPPETCFVQSSCGPIPGMKRFSHEAMATTFQVIVVHEDERYVRQAATAAFNEVDRLESELSRFIENSDISRINDLPANQPLMIGLDAFECLQLSARAFAETDRAFDITIGSITKDLYRFGEDERVASLTELAGANVSFDALVFNEKEAFLEEGAKVDLGGMGKGFGVDKAAEYFRRKDAKSVVIAASGDIRCLSLCRIEVQDPSSEDDVLLSFETIKDDLGITTSGNYNRYVLSTKNNHLIDPKAKKPQSLFVSITLVSDISSSDLDAYATAASVMPTKKAYEFLDSLEVGYIVMQSDGELVVSKNISEYTKNLLMRDAFKKQP